MVIIDGGGSGGYGGNGDCNGKVDESPKLGGREAFVGAGFRHNGICVSRIAVVGREAQWRHGTHQQSGATRYNYFLCPSESGERRTLSVTKAGAKSKVATNSEGV